MSGMSFALIILRAVFSLLALAALAIGAMIFTLGPSVTAAAFATVLSLIAQTPDSVDGLSGANIDSEMRFYSVLWIAYGGLALWVVNSLEARLAWLRVMLAIFLLGGIGRVISHFTVGAPHPLFTVLMCVELALPPFLIALSYARPRRANIHAGD